jgi:hypothetical protein
MSSSAIAAACSPSVAGWTETGSYTESALSAGKVSPPWILPAAPRTSCTAALRRSPSPSWLKGGRTSATPTRLTGTVTDLGSIPQSSICSGTFEPEGVDYDTATGVLRFEITQPGVCEVATTVYEYQQS